MIHNKPRISSNLYLKQSEMIQLTSAMDPYIWSYGFVGRWVYFNLLFHSPRTPKPANIHQARIYRPTIYQKWLITNEPFLNIRSNPKSNKIQQYFHQPEVWAILILFAFQEVPFLLSRIYFIAILKMAKSEMMIFFIAKNVLTIIVFGYRIFYYCYYRNCTNRVSKSGQSARILLQH